MRCGAIMNYREWLEKVKNGMHPLDFSTEEMLEYISSGKGDQNSLEYETAYNKLLNQVKDKSHDDKVKFLLPHIDELREIVDMWSTTNDMNHPLCRPSRDGDEVLAHLIVYRYENHIGVLEDFDHEFTKDYIELINWEVEAKYADEDVKEILKYEEEHPEASDGILAQLW